MPEKHERWRHPRAPRQAVEWTVPFVEARDLSEPAPEARPTPPSPEVERERLVRIVAAGERAQRLLDAARERVEGAALRRAGLLEDEES